ncbi:MAG: hypothetical protein ABR499_23525 [Gemmatimonadaceae bacterium]
MRHVWLVSTLGLLMRLDADECAAQAAGSAPVSAKVTGRRTPHKPRKPPTPPKPAQSAGALLDPAGDTLGPQPTRAAPELFTLDVAGAPLVRFVLCSSDPPVTGDSDGVVCLWRVEGDTSPGWSPPRSKAEELIFHWPDFPDWPGHVSISLSSLAHSARVAPGHYIARFTIIAEY